MRFRALMTGVVWSLAVVVMVASEASANTRQKRSFTDKLHNGIKLAGSILGIDTAADVANLVAKAFGKPANNVTPAHPSIGKRVDYQQQQTLFEGDSQFGGMAPGILSHLLKIIGLDSGKIGAMAVNGIIFIAHMVSAGVASMGKHFKQSFWDWTVIIEYIFHRLRDVNNQTVTTVGVKQFA